MTTQQTEIGSFPSEWNVPSFGTLFDIQQGKQVSKSNREGTNQLPFLRTANVFWGALDLAKLDYMHFSDADVSRLTLHNRDLLVCEGGAIGRAAIWRGELDGCFYQNHLHRLRPKADAKVVPEFAQYWLWYGFEFAKVYSGHGNVTTIPNLSQSRLKQMLLPQPDTNEQRKIARVLTTVQRAIEKQRAIIVTARELKRSLMHKLCTEGLRGEAQKQTEIGLVPESWVVKPLADVGNVIYGIQAAVANKFSPDETPIFTNKNINLEGQLNLTEVNSFRLETPRHFATKLQYGDVLFCWRSGSKEHVGKTAYFDLDGEYTHSSFLLRIRPPFQVIGRYLFLLLNHLRQDGYFVRMQNYAVNAKFNKSAIEQLPVPLPQDDGEMREIVEILDCVMERLELAQRKHDNFQDIFKTLLHQLMTAQIRVHDLDLNALGVPALD